MATTSPSTSASGYAVTVHAAQGVTTDDGFALLSEHASRSMAYVAMTRGRHQNHAFIYQRIGAERDSDHTVPAVRPDIHTLRRGNAYSAVHHLRQILSHDDRPRTMHATAARAQRHLLPDVIADLLERNEHRRAARAARWREHQAAQRTWRHGFEQAASRAASRGLDGEGLEL